MHLLTNYKGKHKHKEINNKNKYPGVFVKGKGHVYPLTCHEGTERERERESRDIALLFL
jgi:hypothetical protein